MGASSNGHREIVRTLLESGAAGGVRENERNQLMIRFKILVNIDDG
jgi:hypothetical protein